MKSIILAGLILAAAVASKSALCASEPELSLYTVLDKKPAGGRQVSVVGKDMTGFINKFPDIKFGPGASAEMVVGKSYEHNAPGGPAFVEMEEAYLFIGFSKEDSEKILNMKDKDEDQKLFLCINYEGKDNFYYVEFAPMGETIVLFADRKTQDKVMNLLQKEK